MGMSRENLQRERIQKSVLKQHCFGVPVQVGHKDPVPSEQKNLQNITIRIATQVVKNTHVQSDDATLPISEKCIKSFTIT